MLPGLLDLPAPGTLSDGRVVMTAERLFETEGRAIFALVRWRLRVGAYGHAPLQIRTRLCMRGDGLWHLVQLKTIINDDNA